MYPVTWERVLPASGFRGVSVLWKRQHSLRLCLHLLHTCTRRHCPARTHRHRHRSLKIQLWNKKTPINQGSESRNQVGIYSGHNAVRQEGTNLPSMCPRTVQKTSIPLPARLAQTQQTAEIRFFKNCYGIYHLKDGKDGQFNLYMHLCKFQTVYQYNNLSLSTDIRKMSELLQNTPLRDIMHTVCLNVVRVR